MIDLKRRGVNLEGGGGGERIFWSKALRWHMYLLCWRNSRERLVELFYRGTKAGGSVEYR